LINKYYDFNSDYFLYLNLTGFSALSIDKANFKKESVITMPVLKTAVPIVMLATFNLNSCQVINGKQLEEDKSADHISTAAETLPSQAIEDPLSRGETFPRRR
jgi:hypothetical protein